MAPLPHPRAAILHPTSEYLEDQPVALIAIGPFDGLVVTLEGEMLVAPYAEIQVVDMAVRTVAGLARDEMARAELEAAQAA